MARKILIIEDNRELAQLLKLHIEDLSCEADLAYDGKIGAEKAESEHYDLIILDIMLPGLDGLEICRRLRATSFIYTPILMLTAKSSELDRVLGLEMGADDYVTKPFSIRELIARVKAIFRRVDRLKSVPDNKNSHVITTEELHIDPVKRIVGRRGKVIDLTAKEFDLLFYFARHPGRVFTRTQLLDEVWGYGHEGYEHTVNSHINRLRAKIEKEPSNPKFVLTVWGVGYKFRDLGD